MNTDDRQIGGISDAPRHGRCYHQCANQAWPFRIGDSIKLPEGDSGLLKNLSDHGQQFPDVIPGGKLGHDSSEVGMYSDLAVDLVRQEAPPVVEDGHAGFVTGGFKAEDKHEIESTVCSPQSAARRPWGPGESIDQRQ